MNTRILSSVLATSLLLITACSPREDQSAAVVNRIREVGKLELTEQRSDEVILIAGSGENLSTVSSLEDAIVLIDDLLRFGDRIGVYSYSHYTIAYIDLSQLSAGDIEVDEKRHSVHLVLPAIQIEPLGRSGTIKLLHERVTGTKRPITSAERARVQEKAQKKAAERMQPDREEYRNLVRHGELQARAYFTGLLRSRGYSLVHIDFKE